MTTKPDRPFSEWLREETNEFLSTEINSKEYYDELLDVLGILALAGSFKNLDSSATSILISASVDISSASLAELKQHYPAWKKKQDSRGRSPISWTALKRKFYVVKNIAFIMLVMSEIVTNEKLLDSIKNRLNQTRTNED